MADHPVTSPAVDRRTFVVHAGALAATLAGTSLMAAASQTPDPAKPAGPELDPIARLNLAFRELYGANREELLASTPLAAVMLIGTGEVWRVESGQPVRAYPPTPWIAHVKGLMHSVIATQACAARLVRAHDLEAARAATRRLTELLADTRPRIADALPAEIVPPAKSVLAALQQLADRWAAGQFPRAGEFRAALEKVQPELERVLTAVGEAVYESVVAGLKQFAAESEPAAWQSCLVGVCGVGFARRDNIEIAAAMSLMGREALGTRLLYFENTFTIGAGAAQIGAAHADLELGRDVFGDPYRMWRDLLGDVAASHAGGGFFPETGRAG